MDQLFSPDCKTLIAKSREIAINLGYDYISTIHFFLADCETISPISIKAFAFNNEEEYIKFKNDYTLKEINYLDFIDDSIPLTKEAESAIRLAEIERVNSNLNMTYPFHILIASLKAKDSVLAECFKTDKDVIEKLVKYYRDLGAYEPESVSVEENDKNKHYSPFKFLVRLFKRK